MVFHWLLYKNNGRPFQTEAQKGRPANDMRRFRDKHQFVSKEAKSRDLSGNRIHKGKNGVFRLISGCFSRSKEIINDCLRLIGNALHGGFRRGGSFLCAGMNGVMDVPQEAGNAV